MIIVNKKRRKNTIVGTSSGVRIEDLVSNKIHCRECTDKISSAGHGELKHDISIILDVNGKEMAFDLVIYTDPLSLIDEYYVANSLFNYLMKIVAIKDLLAKKGLELTGTFYAPGEGPSSSEVKLPEKDIYKHDEDINKLLDLTDPKSLGYVLAATIKEKDSNEK